MEHEMDSDTAAVLLANRAYLYALIARGFAEEPDGPFLDELAGDQARRQVALVEGPLSESACSVHGSLARRAALPDAMDGLRREYARVFVGPGTLKAPPFETVQRSGKRSLFQPGVLEVRACYREAGLLPDNLHHVPDDFVAAEFDFLAKLALRALQAWERGDGQVAFRDLSRSAAFLRDHVLNWIDGFATEVENGYGACFYAQFAALVARRDADIVLVSLEEDGRSAWTG